MPRYVAFLRAINVGGHLVKMADLRAAFESMGFAAVETFIASGNVIFDCKQKNVAQMAKTIADGLQKKFGYEISTFLRTDAEVRAIAQYKPFPEIAVESALTFCVGFLTAQPGADGVRKVLGLRSATDDFHFHGSELYWLSKNRQSESAFSNAVFEKTAGVRATFRGMNTIQKLAAKLPATNS